MKDWRYKHSHRCSEPYIDVGDLVESKLKRIHAADTSTERALALNVK
jgi:hypothetical protein